MAPKTPPSNQQSSPTTRKKELKWGTHILQNSWRSQSSTKERPSAPSAGPAAKAAARGACTPGSSSWLPLQCRASRGCFPGRGEVTTPAWKNIYQIWPGQVNNYLLGTCEHLLLFRALVQIYCLQTTGHMFLGGCRSCPWSRITLHLNHLQSTNSVPTWYKMSLQCCAFTTLYFN